MSLPDTHPSPQREPIRTPELILLLVGLALLAGLTLLVESASAAARPRARTATARTATQPAAKKQAATTAAKREPAKRAAAAGDSSFTMRGGEEGTAFRSLTVEGEDRIQVEFERPPLQVDLDPSKAPGLEWGTTQDVLERTQPDLVTPLLGTTAHQPSAYVGRPWLSQFSSGAVVRFQPEVRDVTRWRLLVANARGETVASYAGKGQPPREMTWDGRAQSGAPVVPGLTYSYVFEAYDRAGNKRNFVGPGFQVSAFRLQGAEGPVLVFSGRDLVEEQHGGWSAGAGTGHAATPRLLLEAASWLNQSAGARQPIRVSASARSAEAADRLLTRVTDALRPLLAGDPSRLTGRVQVEADAPVEGAVAIAAAR